MNVIWFMSGVAFAGWSASALFFIKFWRSSRDPFFLYFAGATALLAMERLLGFTHPSRWLEPLRASPEYNAWTYSCRLIAFVLLVIAILEKNRRSSR